VHQNVNVRKITKEINMIDKIKSKIAHYWSDHKIECLVVAVLVIAYIVK
jgi:hypothetical protein